MKRTSIIIFLSFIITSAFGNDFLTKFLKECVEPDRPVANVNIGKTMLNKMASNSEDEQLISAFRNLISIRIISTENENDSRFYFERAKEMISSDFNDYQEVVSVNDHKTKIDILLKDISEKKQDLILIALDNNEKFTIITISGKIDFNSISKISNVLRENETEKDVSQKELREEE